MGRQLRIIVIEDDPADAIRLEHELARCGIAGDRECVTSRDAFLRALEREPDLILSDHGLPSFSGFDALAITQELYPRIPFIFVTGWYDQGLMVEMFDSGAAGYVYKNRLSELGPVIHQVLEETRLNAGRPMLAQDAAQPPGGLRSSPESKPVREVRLICAQCKRVRSESGDWEPIENCFKRHKQMTITLGMCPCCASKPKAGALN